MQAVGGKRVAGRIAAAAGAVFFSAFLGVSGCNSDRVRGCEKAMLAKLGQAVVEKGVKPELASRVLADGRLRCYAMDYSAKKQPEASKSSEDYAGIFLTKKRISRARANLEENAWWFRSAERKYGVKKEVIAAVIEVESKSGKFDGGCNAPSAFASVYQGREDRRQWAVNEFSALLSFAEKNDSDPFYDSSISGALGITQFLPSSALAYAVDADGMGFGVSSMPDAIYSVANFLKKLRWKQGGSLEKGSRNWRTLWYYNHSDNYVYVILELAKRLE